jgi:membrane-associated protease RseP (regulator of RpoE activity)
MANQYCKIPKFKSPDYQKIDFLDPTGRVDNAYNRSRVRRIVVCEVSSMSQINAIASSRTRRGHGLGVTALSCFILACLLALWGESVGWAASQSRRADGRDTTGASLGHGAVRSLAPSRPGFSPATARRKVLVSNAQNQQQQPGALGVRLRDREGAGAEVTSVLPNSPAAEAAVRVGDVILALDNTSVADSRELIGLIRGSGAGTEVELEIDRQGLRGPLVARLADADEVFRRAALGVVFSKASYGGARVLRVLPDSPADRAGLKMGDRIEAIDGEAVAGYQDAIRRIGRHQARSPLEMRIDRYGLRGSLTATLGEEGEVFAPRPVPVAPVIRPAPAAAVEALSPAMINDQRSYGD